MSQCCLHTPGTTPKATIEEHVEDLLSIKAVTPKAWACGARPPVPTHARTLLVTIPIISCPLITITQTTEGLGHSCNSNLGSSYLSPSFRQLKGCLQRLLQQREVATGQGRCIDLEDGELLNVQHPGHQ